MRGWGITTTLNQIKYFDLDWVFGRDKSKMEISES
jgi:hypothetical protein